MIAVELLRQWVANEELYRALKGLEKLKRADSTVISLLGRFNGIYNDYNSGTINYSEYVLVKNQIRSTIQELIGELPDDLKSIELNSIPSQTKDKSPFREKILEDSMAVFKTETKHIEINPSIQPVIVLPGNNIYEEQILNLEQCLPLLWTKGDAQILLTGKGGAGKTYSLFKLWGHLLAGAEDTSNPVPFYISLHKHSKIIPNLSSSENFILHALKGWNYGKKQGDLEDFFHKCKGDTSGSPKAILMLDGYNELDPKVMGRVLNDIENFYRGKTGLQLIISSRDEINGRFLSNFFKLKLAGLTKAQIDTFLIKHKLPSPNPKLLDVLVNPFYLVLYREIYGVGEKDKGRERLIEAWSNRSKQKSPMPYYQEIETNIDKIDSSAALITALLHRKIAEALSLKDKTQNEKHLPYHMAVVFHVCAYVGYRMVKEEKFHAALDTWIEEYIKNADIRQLGDCFPVYKLLDNVQAQELIEQLKGKLAILFPDNQVEASHGFRHQNFRDYFAALHILNELEYYVNVSPKLRAMKMNKEVPSYLDAQRLPTYLCEMLGEIAREYDNVPQWNEKKQHWSRNEIETPLKKYIELLRGKKVNHVVWNIITIWIESRKKDLSLCDFTRLNLKQLNFYGITFSHRDLDGSFIACDFRKAKFSPKQFFQQGNTEPIHKIFFTFEKDWPEIYKGEPNTPREKTRRLICSESADGRVLWDEGSSMLVAKFSWPLIRVKETELWRTYREEDFFYKVADEFKIENTEIIVFPITDSDLVANYPNLINFGSTLSINTVTRGKRALFLYNKFNLSYKLRFIPLNYKGWYIFSPDYKYVVTSNDETNQVKLYEVDLTKEREPWQEAMDVLAVIEKFQRDEGSPILEILRGREYEFYDLKRGKSLATAKCCCYHPFEDRIIIVEINGRITEWDWKKSVSEPFREIALSSKDYRVIRYSNAGDAIMIASEHHLYEYNLESCHILKTFTAMPGDEIIALDFESPVQKSEFCKIIGSTKENRIYMWNYTTTELIYIYNSNGLSSDILPENEKEYLENESVNTKNKFQKSNYNNLMINKGINIVGCKMSNVIFFLSKDLFDYWIMLLYHGAKFKLFAPIAYYFYMINSIPDLLGRTEKFFEKFNNFSVIFKVVVFLIKIITNILWGLSLFALLIPTLLIIWINNVKKENIIAFKKLIKKQSSAKLKFIPSKLIE